MTGAQVLAIDFGGTKIALATAAVGSPDGRPDNTVRLRTLGAAGAVQAVERTFDAARALLAGPAAVGVSTFGVLRGGRVQLAPNVPGWEGMALPALLRAEFGDAPVAIDNDVNAGAAAELRWGALRGVDVGLYVNLGTGLAAVIMRQTRSSMLDALSADYIRTAEAKGLRPRAVIGRHALRNSLIVVVTIVGLQLGALISGAVVTERIFALPGFGKQKAQIFVALLAKQLGVRPEGWEAAVGDYALEGHRSVADVVDAESLQKVRDFKKSKKAAARGSD